LKEVLFLIFNEKLETLERSQMEALQLGSLKKTVERVYSNVPFYREKFKQLGIKPSDIQGLDDIHKLPFTVKKDLRDHYPYGLFASPMQDIIRLHASSGTSGKPTVVGYTRNDIDNWGEIVARSITASGGGSGDIMHNAYGYGLFTGGLGMHTGGEKLGIATVPVSGGNTNRQIMLIEDFMPKVICSTPSYALHIAEVMEEQGKDPRKTSLKYGIFGSEPWSEELRRTLEEKLDIKAVDIYGLSEVVGPGVAIECHEEQNGLHIQEDHFFVEVIDPDTLEALPDKSEGELVFTSLTKEAFPVLRYRSGDIATITRDKCKCGRTTVRMSRLKGRIDDMIIVRGVNVFPSQIENSLLQINDLAPHYQVYLKRTGAIDTVELHVELTEDSFSTSLEDIEHNNVSRLKKRIQSIIKDECLVSIGVNILPPKSIPRSEGKAVRVVDERTKEVVI